VSAGAHVSGRVSAHELAIKDAVVARGWGIAVEVITGITACGITGGGR
jgi:hypothetical protein